MELYKSENEEEAAADNKKLRFESIDFPKICAYCMHWDWVGPEMNMDVYAPCPFKSDTLPFKGDHMCDVYR